METCSDDRNPEHLQTARQHAVALVEQLHTLAAEASQEEQPTWGAYVATAQEVVQFLESGGANPLPIGTACG